MKLSKIFNPQAYLRKLKYLDAGRRYRRYYRQIRPTEQYLEKLRRRQFNYQPLISIIVPTYNTKKEFFVDMIESVLAQVYPNWQLVVVDDASPDPTLRQLIRRYAASDRRIKAKLLRRNHHIAGATNEGFRIADGEFIMLLDHDDILWADALYEIVKALNRDRQLDIIYGDEDKVSFDGKNHLGPFLRPDWNPDLLLSMNYLTHAIAIRKSIIDQIGGEDSRYNGAQDWDLFLRATEATTPEKIHHIPKFIYSWRVHSGSTAQSFANKSYVVTAQRRLLEAALARRGYQPADYQLHENSGIWTIQIKGVTPQHGQPDLDQIKGLALSARQIRRQLGSGSLTYYNYHHAQYDVHGKLFVPEKIYRKYWKR